MDTEKAIETVQAWQAASNAQDIDRLLALSDRNVELVGPRGSGRGHRLLQEWNARSGLTLTTKRIFVRGDSVVAEQRGLWRSTETGAPLSEADMASRYKVTQGKIAQYQRYDSLDSAFKDADINESDEVLPD
jgi:ketosteroid isomerase-like protein